MDYFSSMEISASGMATEKLRLEAVAMNLANAGATAPPGARPYQPLRVVSRPIGGGDFSRHLQGARALPQAQAGYGVISNLQTVDTAPHRVRDPQHPDADAEGFVNQANVDPLAEMVTMMSAVRAYEANLKAINAARAMAQAALDIGKK